MTKFGILGNFRKSRTLRKFVKIETLGDFWKSNQFG